MFRALELIQGRARIKPAAKAIVLRDRVATYGMMHQGIMAAAMKIESLQLDPGKPVGVLIENPLRNVVVNLALGQCGLCSVALRPALAPHLGTLGLSCILSDRPVKGTGIASHLVDDGWFAAASPPPYLPARAVPPESVVRVEFTSGSTGTPKAVGFTGPAIHGQTVNRICSYAIAEDVSCSMFSVTSNVGFGFVLASLAQGKTVIIPDSNDSALDLMQYHDAGVLAGSPAQISGLMTRAEAVARPVPGLRKIILAGAVVTGRDLARIRLAFGADIHIDYGSTEAGPSAFAAGVMLSYDDHSSPSLWPHQDIEVVGDPGRTSKTVGPLRVRSSGMGFAYSGTLTQTDADRGDGWFYPGDQGYFDDEGYLTLVGRQDELVNIRGVKHNFDTIDARLREMPGVIEAAVVRDGGAAGPDTGLWAFIVSRGELQLQTINDALASHVRGLALNGVTRVETIPKTETGKVDRQQLSWMRQGSRTQ